MYYKRLKYIKNDKKFFEFMIDEYTVYDYNNRIISEINAPILNNDGVMIPLSVICELFDVKSEWHFAEEILFINKKFDDVEYTDVYCEAILGMYYKGVINGDENGVFHSQDFVKRSEASAMFSRTMGHEYDSYFFYCSDVDRDHWAQSFIGICINEGLFELENGKFRPNDNITVKETVIAALKMNGIYSENYIEKAKENGLLYLIDEENIERDITRAEMSQLLYNASK